MAITKTTRTRFAFIDGSPAIANTSDLTVGSTDVGRQSNLVYDADTGQLKFHDGSNWHQVVSEQNTTNTAGAGNGETLDTTNSVSFYDPGATRTGVILEAGVRDGQRVTVVNIGNAAEDVIFAASGTSNVSGGTDVIISQHEAKTFVWNATTSLWYVTDVRFGEQSAEATGAGNDETIDTTNRVSFYDPGGASRTGVILEAGVRDAQQVTVVNIANAAEDITFAAAGTSNVAGGASVVISQFEATTFTWHASTALWYAGNLT